MIDKLELRVVRSTPFRPAVHKLLREVNFATALSRVRPSRFYAAVADLRPLGIDAILHANYKMGDRHDHKLELLDTGKKSYSDLVAQVESAFEANPEHLEIMRIDLCADVPGTPVMWFQPRVRIKYKRLGHEIGKLEYDKIGRTGVETLSAGKRPNIFRIYDKVAESKMQFRKMLRKANTDAEPPTFEEEFGFAPDAVLTRVERQIGGARIPDCISTFGKLAYAPEFNPFTPLEITSGTGAEMPPIQEAGLDEWLKGTRLNELAHEMGMQQLRGFMNKHSNGNAARYFEKYGKYFPQSGEQALTSERIYEIYRKSVIRQLAA